MRNYITQLEIQNRPEAPSTHLGPTLNLVVTPGKTFKRNPPPFEEELIEKSAL